MGREKPVGGRSVDGRAEHIRPSGKEAARLALPFRRRALAPEGVEIAPRRHRTRR